LLRCHIPVFHKIGAAPSAAAALDDAGEEEQGAHGFDPRDPQGFPDGKGFGFCGFCGAFCGVDPFPNGQREEHQYADKDLDEECDLVAVSPTVFAADDQSEDIGADRYADSIKAVEKIHLLGRVMQCHIVIQCHVDCTGTDAKGHSQQHHQPNIRGEGKSDQGKGGKEGAEGGNLAGAEFADQPGTDQAGENGAAGNGGGDEASVGDGKLKIRINRRPCCPK